MCNWKALVSQHYIFQITHLPMKHSFIYQQSLFGNISYRKVFHTIKFKMEFVPVTHSHFNGASCFLCPPAIGLGSLFAISCGSSGRPKGKFIWCYVWSIDYNLIPAPPRTLGLGAKFNGCGAPAMLPDGGTELPRAVGLWSKGYKCMFFLLFFFYSPMSSRSSCVSTPWIY